MGGERYREAQVALRFEPDFALSVRARVYGWSGGMCASDSTPARPIIALDARLYKRLQCRSALCI